jgi:hypothetical protein
MDYKVGDRINLGSRESPDFATIKNVTDWRVLVSWDQEMGVVLLPRRMLELLAIGPEA